MPNQAAKFVSAIFASLLAGAAFATISHGTADAAEDCLAGPKGQTPEGSHWYYRIDRATKRHCWYLRDEGEKLAQSAPPATAWPARPTVAKAETAMQTETAMQRSVADARAEFSAQTHFEQPKRGDEPAMAVPAGTATWDNYGATPPPHAATPESVVASRWPDASAASVPAGPAPVRPDVMAAVSPPAPALPPTAIAAGAAADASSQAPTYSVQMQLAALMAALAFAGLLVSAIFKFAGPKRPARQNLRARRHPGTIWEPTDDDRIVLETDVPARRSGFARDVGRRDNANDRVAEFFSQLSRRAPT
jgi:hypothetical protein